MSAAIRTTLQGVTGCAPKMAGRTVEVGSASNATGALTCAVAARSRRAAPSSPGECQGSAPAPRSERSPSMTERAIPTFTECDLVDAVRRRPYRVHVRLTREE